MYVGVYSTNEVSRDSSNCVVHVVLRQTVKYYTALYTSIIPLLHTTSSKAIWIILNS